MVSDLEVQLLQFFRKELGGVEFNIMSHPGFISDVRPMLHKIAEREKALHAASMKAIKAAYKPGPAKATAA